MKSDRIVFVREGMDFKNKFGMNYRYSGMVLKIPSVNRLVGGQATYIPEGIGRCIFEDSTIHEGVFKNGVACGYQRIFYNDGSKYIGQTNERG